MGTSINHCALIGAKRTMTFTIGDKSESCSHIVQENIIKHFTSLEKSRTQRKYLNMYLLEIKTVTLT